MMALEVGFRDEIDNQVEVLFFALFSAPFQLRFLLCKFTF